jgi:mono/diheme cytochrome c family protein
VQTPEDRFYNPARINAWFAASAILAFAATAAAVLADHYDREWKEYQHGFHSLERKRAEEALALEKVAPPGATPGALRVRDRLLLAGFAPAAGLSPADARRADAEAFEKAVDETRYDPDFPTGAALALRAYEEAAAALETKEFIKEKAGLEAARDRAEADRFKTEKIQRELKALEDEYKYRRDHALSQGHDAEAEIVGKEWTETAGKEKEVHARMDGFALEKLKVLNGLKDLQAPITLKRDRARRLREMAGVAGAEKKLASFVAGGLRDAPLLDPFAPVTKIEQKVFPELTEDYNFAQIGRVDRCITCHKGIDKVSVDPKTGEVTPVYTAANTPERVYRTHSKPELYVSSVSKHSMDKMGCTICHGGLGWGLSFADAYHTPNDAAQEKEWEEKHHWHRGESWDFPMLPMKYVDAACFKCHRDQAHLNPEDKFIKEIPGAPLWNKGLHIVERHGCFGCHKIDGLAVPGLDRWIAEIKDEDRRGYATAISIRKTGPNLKRVAAKWVSRDAIWKWIWNPPGLRPTTNMPRFFGQPNNSGMDPLTHDDYDLRTRTEVWGLAELVWSLSREPEADGTTWKPDAPPVKGDAARGKILFGGDLDNGVRSVGCVACHTTKDFPNPSGGKPNDFGPELSSVGSKTTEAWLYTWLKGPSHYWQGTRMPSLRLSDQEAADAAAYLMTLRNPEWEKQAPPPVVEEMVRQLAVEAERATARASDPETPEERVRKASPEERLRMVGRRALKRYACFGCHEIKGYENEERIGTELGGSEGWGSKDVDRLDFGLMEDPKSVATYGSWRTDLIPDRPEGGRALPHRKPEWAWLKLKNPRVYDAGVTKQPHEKLVMPNFSLSDEEADAVVCVLLSLQRGEVPSTKRPVRDTRQILEEKMKWVARQYNCYGCHTLKESQAEKWIPAKGVEKEGRRGPVPVAKGGDIRPWLGDDSDWWPPSLGGEGRSNAGEGTRVQPAWLFSFFRSPGDPADPAKNMLRYFLQTRMPTFDFTQQELNAVVQGFAAQDGVPFPFEKQQAGPLSKEDEADAKAIFEQVQCFKCHRMEGRPKPSGLAPDLAFTPVRLRHQWVRLWLSDPEAILPGTKMPSVWHTPREGQRPPDGLEKTYFGGDPDLQMRKVADYLFTLGRPAGEPGSK